MNPWPPEGTPEHKLLTVLLTPHVHDLAAALDIPLDQAWLTIRSLSEQGYISLHFEAGEQDGEPGIFTTPYVNLEAIPDHVLQQHLARLQNRHNPN